MDRLQWIFELTDRMTGPARRITGSLDAVDGKLRAVNRSTRALDANQRSQAASTRFTSRSTGQLTGALGASNRALDRHSRAAQAAARAHSDLSESASGGLTRLGSSLVSFGAGALKIAAATAALTGLAAAAYGANSAIEAMVSRERNLRALTTLLGSADEALRVRNRVTSLSEFLGVDPNEAQRNFQELLSKGFSEGEAMRIFQGLSDVASISPTADMSRIILAISQIRQAGRLQGDELNQLAESGLPLENVYKRIGAAMGVAASEVRDLRGQVPAAVAIEAILGGIQDTTGRALGGLAREASLGLGGQLERLQQAPARFFQALADESSVAGQRMTQLVARLNEILNPRSATGQRILAAMVDALSLAVTAAEKFGGFLAWATDAARGLLDAIPPATLRRLTNGFKILGAIMLAAFAAPIIGIAAVGAGLLLVADYLGGLVEPFVRFGEWMDRIATRLGTFVAQMRVFGHQVIAGWVGGFTSGVAQALTAVQTFASQVERRMRSALQIHSPSRVFMGLGAMTGEGFAIGLERSMPGLDFGDVGTVGAPATPGPALGSLGSARAMSISAPITIEVTAQPGENAQDTADRIGEAVRRELAALFEGFALETGTN